MSEDSDRKRMRGRRGGWAVEREREREKWARERRDRKNDRVWK